MIEGSSSLNGQSLRRDIAILLAICGLTLFLNLGGPQLWDRDEPRNAGCAREMLQRGDWIVPTFNEELRSQKPVLTYWMMMCSYALFGVSEYAARFGSALLGTLTVLMTYLAGRRLFGERPALWSGIILASSLMFVVASRAATPDAALIACSSAALLLFASCGVSDVRRRVQSAADRPAEIRGVTFFQSSIRTAAFYGLLGLAVLAKGPAGLVIPLAIVGLWMLIVTSQIKPASDSEQGPLASALACLARILAPAHFWRTGWSMRPILGLACVLLVASPWYLAVGWRTDGVFLQEFFLRENLARATATFENHSGGWWYYPIALLVGFFPWSVFAVPFIGEIDRRRAWRVDPSVMFLLIWIGIQVGLFTLARTKLPSYVTPCYPALALLGGWMIAEASAGRSRISFHWYRRGFAAAVICGVAIALAAWYAGREYLGGDFLVGLVGLPIAGGGLLAWWYSSPRAYAWASVLFIATLFAWGAVRVDQVRRGNAVVQAIREADATVRVYSYRCLESSWVFYGEKPIHELALNAQASATSQPLRRDNAPRKFWQASYQLPPEQIALHSDPALIITTDEHLAELQTRLGNSFEVVARAPYFTRDESLVLLSRKRHRSASARAQTAAPR